MSSTPLWNRQEEKKINKWEIFVLEMENLEGIYGLWFYIRNGSIHKSRSSLSWFSNIPVVFCKNY